jgi:hypothetical protein
VSDVVRLDAGKFQNLVDTLELDNQTLVLGLLRDAVLPESDVIWGVNWYKTRRHIPAEDATVERVPNQRGVVGSLGEVRAHCSQWTTIFLKAYTTTNSGYSIPPANSEEVMAVPACKICLKAVERKSKQ